MQPSLAVLNALLYCSYKAWRYHHDNGVANKDDFTNIHPLAKLAWDTGQVPILSPNNKRKAARDEKAAKLLAATTAIVEQASPPPFYKIPHCSECPYRQDCFKKLRERDCLSLLAGMTPKVRVKYQKKGITTITQLSHLFRPRRRRRAPQAAGNYLWELKALAIREQKTFVVYPPERSLQAVSIYVDFEGIPDESFHYLAGVLIQQENKPEERFSFWADSREQEKAVMQQLFALFQQYPEASIYHFGSYETKALKQAVKKWPGTFKKPWAVIEGRMVNLLGYLRTHVYPPTYGNGLKEVAGFLGYRWQEEEADGRMSIQWRKDWENTKEAAVKEKLLAYNLDDCGALALVHHWFVSLSAGATAEGVQQVSEMKKFTPYLLQKNKEYGDDFQAITKAAYFDYQRNKIYWRTGSNKKPPKSDPASVKPKQSPGKGVIAWQPKKANEVIIIPPLKVCPHCGHTKLYQSRSFTASVMQTDLKFTASGIRRHVTEYKSGNAKCAGCGKKMRNKNLRMQHYGDNLFALVINYYVRYHISNELISKLIGEHYGIWISPMYLVMYKNRWWQKNWQPVATYIQQIVLKSGVIHIDETTIKLAKESGYVWVFATTHSVFYHYTPTRDSSFLQIWLKEYKGIIITDFFPGYETLNVKRQKCLVHLIRDLNDELFKNPFDEAYKAMVSAFSKLLRKMIETIDKYGLQKKHLARHVGDTEAFYKEFVEGEHKSELSIKYAKRFKKHWEEHWTFLHHDNVPWNNNNAEAAVKAFAQHRRGVKGQMHVRGLTAFLEMLSVAQTCRYRNLSFLSFLRKNKGIWENVPSEALPPYLPFDQAKLFVHRLGFDRKAQWNEWKRAGIRPKFIPSNPQVTYKDKGWVDLHDWLGFSFLPFAKARTYMRRLGLKNRDEYWAWLASGKRPKNIPYSPEVEYEYTGWVDLGDWLGTRNKGKQKKKRLSYQQCKAYVQALGLKAQQQYFEWRKSGARPETVPSSPDVAYPEFEGWGVFLGTDRVANQNKEYWDYAEAKAFLSVLRVQSWGHFDQLYLAGIIPKTIPQNPYVYYKRKGEWKSFDDFFGSELS